jgi:hypothetical protein
VNEILYMRLSYICVHACVRAQSGSHLVFPTVSQLAQKEQYKRNSKQQEEAEAAQFLADYQAGVEADRAAEAARRARRIDLKQYHLKQVRAGLYARLDFV